MSNFEDNLKHSKYEDEFEDDPELSENYEKDSENDTELFDYEKDFENDPELSDYEKLRLRNIKENRKQMALILGDAIEQFTKSLRKPKLKQARFKKSRRSTKSNDYQPLRRSGRIQKTGHHRPERHLLYGSRKCLEIIRKIIGGQTVDWNHNLSFSKEDSGEWDEDENWKGWFDIDRKKKVIRQMPTLKAFRKPEKLTLQDLNNVAMQVSFKIKHTDGTTCHQCRQKTLDMKTICRSSKCRGVRGQFCGVCLRNRYGECAKDALLNPNWLCPPCRSICNCSICRNKIGLSPTGILYPKSLAEGFKSVHDHLLGTEPF